MDERAWHSSYDPGVPRQIDFEPLTVPRLLERSALESGDGTALEFMNRRMTYRQLKEAVDRLATALAGLGVRRDTRVAIHLPNLPQTVISYYATLSLGAQAVLTNPLYTPREIEHQWNDAGCELAVTADFLYTGRLEELRGSLPVKNYLVASIPEYLRFPLNLLAPWKLKRHKPPLIAKVEPGPGVHFFRRLVESTAPDPPRVEIGLDDVAILQYTGGTTGVSKGAMLTHRNLSANTQQIAAWLSSENPRREVVLGALPFFHVFGMTVAMNFPVFLGATMVLLANPRDVPFMIRSITRHRVSIFPAAPAMFIAIAQHPGIEKIDLSSLEFCVSGSAPLAEDVLRRFEALTGSYILEGFGLTEASPVTHVNPARGERRVNAIGLPLPNTDSRIVSLDDGGEVPAGQEGELLIQGPQVMVGYWNMPDETADALRDGWLHTGDLALMDEDGYHRIVGRSKEMIVASGYNVYPDEVDRVLMEHPAVLEAATIGVPHEKRGETVKSFLVLEPGQEASAEEIVVFCKERLAAYKVPKMIEFRDELPKSAVLKTLRRELREEELAKIREVRG